MRTYFVSTEEHASDENDGTERRPFATILHAMDVIGDDPNGMIVFIFDEEKDHE